MTLSSAPSWPDLLYLRLRWNDPQTIGDLAESMQAPRRAIEQAVETLRLTGCPIVTSGRGVALSTDSRELEQAADRLRRRAITQWYGARALKRTAERYASQKVRQMEMFGG